MNEELKRLDDLLTSVETPIRRAFSQFIASVTDAGVLREIIELIVAGRIEAALDIASSYVADMANTLSTQFQRIGNLTAVELSSVLPVAAAIGFDPTYPRAAEMMRRNRLEFISNFTAQQRASVRQALARDFITGEGPAAAERAFRQAVGLTQYQEGIVANYRRNLETGNAHALDYDLRDRRFDSVVDRSVIRYDPKTRSYNRTGKPLTQKQIDAMVDRYRRRYRMMRGETIARTEALKTLNQAREEAMLQSLQQTGISPDKVTRIWNATEDARTRDSHVPMDGQERAIGAAFISGAGNALLRPGDPNAPAGEIINCRCVVTFRFAV